MPGPIVSHAGRRELAARLKHIYAANDAGRAPKNPAEHLGQFTMEDFANVADAYGPYYFHGDKVLPPKLKRMVELLVRAVRHYLCIGNPDDTFTTASCTEAADALLEYAQIIESGVRAGDLPPTLLTYTLHLACHR